MSQSTPQHYDDLNTSKLLTAAALGISITLASVIWLHAMYAVQETAIEKERTYETPAKVRETKDAWTKTLTSWGGKDEVKKIGQVPIARAIDAVVQEHQGN